MLDTLLLYKNFKHSHVRHNGAHRIEVINTADHETGLKRHFIKLYEVFVDG